MKAHLVIFTCLLSACTAQPTQKTVENWIERSFEPKKVFDVAWFDGDWRVCEVETDCPKITPKSAIRTVSLKAIHSIPADTLKKEKVSIHFDSDGAEPRDLIDLKRFLQTINTHDQLLITGYTDSLGDDSYNQLLARKRANKVFAWLKQRGIKNLMKVEVGGACCYLAPNDTERGRALNRRVIVEIIHEESKRG